MTRRMHSFTSRVVARRSTGVRTIMADVPDTSLRGQRQPFPQRSREAAHAWDWRRLRANQAEFHPAARAATAKLPQRPWRCRPGYTWRTKKTRALKPPDSTWKLASIARAKVLTPLPDMARLGLAFTVVASTVRVRAVAVLPAPLRSAGPPHPQG